MSEPISTPAAATPAPAQSTCSTPGCQSTQPQTHPQAAAATPAAGQAQKGFKRQPRKQH